MGNIASPSLQPQKPIGKKRTKMQRRWTAMVRDYDKLTTMKDALDKPSNGCLTKEMVAFKTAIDEHFTAPGLMEAFKGIHTIHPQWNMPDWFTEKLEIQVEQSKQEVLVDETDQKAEKLE